MNSYLSDNAYLGPTGAVGTLRPKKRTLVMLIGIFDRIQQKLFTGRIVIAENDKKIHIRSCRTMPSFMCRYGHQERIPEDKIPF